MVKRERLPEDIRERLPQLVEQLRRDRHVVAAYLFGSFARGTEGPLSDIDIAVLLQATTPAAALARLTLEYLGRVNRALGTDEVSFVLLNDAPLTLRYAVIRAGRVLVDNDRAARLAFEVWTEDLYIDFKPALDAYDDMLLRQLTA